MPVLRSWLTEPLWGQFSALLPERPRYHPDHPLRCHRPRINDRIVFDKLLQVLRFSCSYEAIADTTCSASTICSRRDEWIRLGVFSQLKQIVLNFYDRIVGLMLDQVAVGGSITKAPGGGEVAGRSPLPAPSLDRLADLGPLPEKITVHLDAGYDSNKTRALLNECGPGGRISHKGQKAPIQASRRWHVERTHAWQNGFSRLSRCYERRAVAIDAFFDLADTIITVRSLIRRSRTAHRWDNHPRRRP